MSSNEAVWFQDDLEIARAIREMRPAARRPLFWAAILFTGVLIAGGVIYRARFFPPKPAAPELTSAPTLQPTTDFAEVELPPPTAKKVHVSAHHATKQHAPAISTHAAPELGRTRSHGGLLPRRTWPSWASTRPSEANRSNTPAPGPVRPAVPEAPAPTYAAVAPMPMPTIESEDESSVGPAMASAHAADVTVEPDTELGEVSSSSPALSAWGRTLAQAKRQAVRACYERELKRDPQFGGEALVRLELAPPGIVEFVRVDGVAAPGFASCVEGVFGNANPPEIQDRVQLDLPFLLRPQSHPSETGGVD